MTDKSRPPLLADDHKGTRVDYIGMLTQARAALENGAKGLALAEMLRQFQGHLKELGARWYAGDTAVVDELLQLYCVEPEARAALVGQAAPSAQEPVGHVFTMEALDGRGRVVHHAQLNAPLPAGTPLYAAPVAAEQLVRNSESAKPLPPHQMLMILNAYEAGVGKGREAFRKGASTGNPYTDASSDCAVAWGVGFDEGKDQAKREAEKPAAQEPVAWQFFEDSAWHIGMDVHDHRKNTEAAGIPTRDLYAAPVASKSAAKESFVTLHSLLRALQNAHVRVSGSATDGWKVVLPTAPVADQEPVAWLIDWPDEPDLGHYLAESPAEIGRSRALVFRDAAPVAAQAQPYALRYAQELAKAIFQHYYAGDEAYASGSVKWVVGDDLICVLTQIDNMISELMCQPTDQALPTSTTPPREEFPLLYDSLDELTSRLDSHQSRNYVFSLRDSIQDVVQKLSLARARIADLEAAAQAKEGGAA